MPILWSLNILLETLPGLLVLREVHSKMPSRDLIDPGQLRHQSANKKPTIQAVRRYKLELHPGKSGRFLRTDHHEQ